MKNLKIAAFSFAVLVLTGSAFGQDFKDASFPDTPKNHWAYEAVDAAFKLVQPEFSYFHHRGSEFNSRIKFTQAIVHVYSQLAEVEANSLVRARQVQVDLSKTDWQKLELRSILNSHQERVDAEDEVEKCQEATLQLKRVFNEFLPELKYLQRQEDGSKYRLFETDYRVRVLELTPAPFASDNMLEILKSESESDIFFDLPRNEHNRLTYRLITSCATRFDKKINGREFSKLSFSDIEISALIIGYYNDLLRTSTGFELKVEKIEKQLMLVEGADDLIEAEKLRNELRELKSLVYEYDKQITPALYDLLKLIHLKSKSLSGIYHIDTDLLKEDVSDFIPRIKALRAE